MRPIRKNEAERTVCGVDRRAARYGVGWFFGQSASGDIHALILSWALLAYSQVASLPQCPHVCECVRVVACVCASVCVECG